MVHVFIFAFFGTALSIRYARVPNKSSCFLPDHIPNVCGQNSEHSATFRNATLMISNDSKTGRTLSYHCILAFGKTHCFSVEKDGPDTTFSARMISTAISYILRSALNRLNHQKENQAECKHH